MNLDDLQALESQLIGHEGLKLYVYDDATGMSLRPGVTCIGNPTIGVGRELGRHGLSTEEVRQLLTNDITETVNALDSIYPWFLEMDAVRQRVLIDMAFNLGMKGLAGFPKFLTACAVRDYETAATEMLTSKWAGQVKGRATALAQMLRTGQA